MDSRSVVRHCLQPNLQEIYMTLEVRSVTWSVDDELDDAITTLVRTVVPDYKSFNEYTCHGEEVLATARNVAEAFKSGRAVYKDGQWLVEASFDDAITELIHTVVDETARQTRLAGKEYSSDRSATALPAGPYSEHVYAAARKVAETFGRSEPFYFYRLSDIAEYPAELERRRQIGLTIDPATAETGFWEANLRDPYKILDEKHHGDIVMFQYYVRNPGASQKDWVHLYDLPKARRIVFRARDEQLIELADWGMEFERRRRIGVTIDPTTAEIASGWREFGDPYEILDGNFWDGEPRYEHFARNPGGEWVRYGDLPESTEKALSKRDEHQLDGENINALSKAEPPPYEAELERRRLIGRTIDPATAEAELRWVDPNDPYGILDEKYHGTEKVHEYFVRNPGASETDWVHLYDLPRATRTAFRSSDNRLIDRAEYDVEFERRRRIGVTIDPAIAETATWRVNRDDPYAKLDIDLPAEETSYEHFARNPGGEWVVFGHLPVATRKILFKEAQTIFRDRMIRNKGSKYLEARYC
jgi:hypothetical protein